MTQNAVSLTTISAGEKVKIACLRGGTGFKSRITAMGVHVGLLITVVCNQEKGPIVINVKGARVVIGHGMAAKVGVYRQKSNNHEL